MQSDEVIRDFLKLLLPFNLTKGEKLMLLNNRPVAESVLVAMIEECEERFSEEQRTELLGIVSGLPEPPTAEEAHAEGAADVDDEGMAVDGQEGAWDAEEEEYAGDADDFVNEKDQVDSGDDD